MKYFGEKRATASYQTFLGLVSVYGLLRRVGDRFFRPYGISQTQFNVLVVLKYDLPDGCPQNDLAAHLKVGAADVSGIVRRMSGRDLVERAVNPEDERSRIVRLAPKGAGLLDRIEPEFYQQVMEIMEVHPKADRERFAGLLKRSEEALLAYAPA